MTVAPYYIHRMIQAIHRDPEACAAFASDPAPYYARYGLDQRQIALLEDASVASMTELGVHPNLQMKYLRMRTPRPAAGESALPGPLDAYLDRLLEKRNG
ncbi:hypothetical protein [Novosphingobium aerophilum]|uniref:Extradiol ring-cleavage dioxygenase LigAB LigA subunit domain-containing protein n=1 Tax=Novosphingobium aerophilum TaxID=2839843 RepID=A0A7X1FAP5_9SPHN|nr:hypothetical protein [Novosphingobium aerophilum]MBC2653513.1 hypothetical protein [Novosphingobium aerophilum]